MKQFRLWITGLQVYAMGKKKLIISVSTCGWHELILKSGAEAEEKEGKYGSDRANAKIAIS